MRKNVILAYTVDNKFNIREILERVLQVIGYEDDHNDFINNFIIMCAKRAHSLLISTLSEEKQYEFIEKINQQATHENVNIIIQDYFSAKVYDQYMIIATQELFNDYLITILPILSNKQKNELQTYIFSFIPNDF